MSSDPKVSFDPSGTASHEVGLFGWPSQRATAQIVLLPVPWDVTTSYGDGTAKAPQAILEASPQIDLFDLEFGKAYEQGYFLTKCEHELEALNAQLKPKARRIRQGLENNDLPLVEQRQLLDEVNRGCEQMIGWVHSQSQILLSEKKIPAVVGGDHSSPEGLIQAIGEHTRGDFGILHIDAHADLRAAYQGFTHSHASIMYNVMHAEWKPRQLVQVGIRDFCQEEYDLSQSRHDIKTFFDLELKDRLFQGATWDALCKEIISALPERVYLSFDIDGLSPEFCPNTGTPVPGGLSFDQANYLLKVVVRSGRKIIGFDLNEVAPSRDGSAWDANVGARMLYKMCGWAVHSHVNVVS